MLNPASRCEENAEASSSLLRPLAIFFVIALALALTSRQPVQAASRQQTSRHAASEKIQPQPARERRSHSTTSHKARVRSAKATTSSRHERARERAVSSRGRRRVATSRRRSVAQSAASGKVRSRKVSLETVVASRRTEEPMARPVAGASSLVEATSTGGYVDHGPHPAGDDRISTASANDTGVSATVSLSPSEHWRRLP